MESGLGGPPRDWRMPSPISEDEVEPDTPTAFTQSQLSRLTVDSGHNSLRGSVERDATATSAGWPGNKDWNKNGEWGKDENMEEEGAGHDGDDVAPVPLARKGRARSGAFTGKGRFSMGFREDCEKCRARIPGHYSHFLPG